MRSTTVGVFSLILLMCVLLIPSEVAADDPMHVVATTPWTAAFALAAGADHVDVLAPYDMQHPPEYELRATDIGRARNADLLIYAGYEAMMGRIGSALGEAAPDMLQIQTDHAQATIEASVMAIAEELGTEEVARARVAELIDFLDEWRGEIDRRGADDLTVITHAFQAPILRELGIEPVGVFGPGPLSAGQIDQLSRRNPDLVVDVWHNQSAAPLRETVPEAEFVALINFPGRDGTRTLMDVLAHKRLTLGAALEQVR